MSYKGLVIGGHLAGEWRSHDLPTFSALAPDAGRVQFPDGSMMLWDGDPVLETWVHVEAEPHGEFWVPQGKDATWAMTELIRAYRSQRANRHTHFPEMAKRDWQSL
jgi:hypothetical protein